MMIRQMEEAIRLINKSSNIFIASHINPDGDSLGSSLALALALKEKEKKVHVLKSDIVPKDFAFLPGIHLVKEYAEDMGKIDLFIAVDSSDPDRLGENKSILDLAKNIINIDHHISNTNFGTVNIVDPKAAATGQLIFDLIKEMGIRLNKEMAENIYTAISTDTGNFVYEGVTGQTHRIVAQLIDTGINVGEINQNLYENMTIEKIRLLVNTLSAVKFYQGNQVAIAKVTQEMLKDAGALWEDTEGLVSLIRKIDTVEVACLLKEYEPKEIKASLRSKNYLDVSKVCSKLGGGGHIRAAGCTIYSDIEEAEEKIIAEIKSALR